MQDTVEINGELYVRQSALPSGARAVVVVDRGWVFAGDVEEADGRIRLSRAIWCFRWEEIALDGMIADPRSKKVTLKPVPGGTVDLPSGAEIFRIPVCDNWGL